MDQRLDAYLHAADSTEQQERLGELMTACADPVIRRTVHSRLSGRWDDIEDVCSEARLELLLYLRRMKAKPGAVPIDDFGAYVGTLAANTCHHYFRRRRSGWARLKSQIRFLLQDSEFRSWEKLGTIWCGLASWREDHPVASPEILGGIVNRLEGNRNLAALLEQIFEAADGPIPFDALTDLVARMWRIAPDSEGASVAVDAESIPAAAYHAELSIDRRRYTARLWQEIHELPRPQRIALLLNLRDGRGSSILSLFQLAGVASFPETARALEIGDAELASIWVELPWDDNTIAKFLGATRQQVINLRMAARKRLVNRLGDQPV